VALTNFVYSTAKEAVLGLASATGPINFTSDTFYLLLVTSTYTALSQATAEAQEFLSDVNAVSGAEATGTGYTAGGQALAGLAVSLTGTTTGKVAVTNPSWASSTVTAVGAILYKHTGTATTSTLIAYYDFGGSVASTAGTFTVSFASGLLTLA
jgi:hypothetical protein